MAVSDAIDVVKLMAEELGIHSDNGERLLERGYVTLDEERLSERFLDPTAANGRYLTVLGRQLRVQAPTRYLPPQGELF